MKYKFILNLMVVSDVILCCLINRGQHLMPWCPMLHASDKDAGWKSDLTTPMSFWYYIMVSVNYSLTCGMAEEQKEHGAQIML